MFAKQRSKKEGNKECMKRKRSVSPIPSSTQFGAAGKAQDETEDKKLKLA